MSIFLAQDDIAILTGKKKKSCQVDQLREMGILFYINAAGRPVVPVASVEERDFSHKTQKKEWQPALLK